MSLGVRIIPRLDIKGMNVVKGIQLEGIRVLGRPEVFARPRSALIACARALRSGGQIHLTTGNRSSLLARLLGRRWRLITPPQHISYFSVDPLSNLLAECGFQEPLTDRKFDSAWGGGVARGWRFSVFCGTCARLPSLSFRRRDPSFDRKSNPPYDRQPSCS